MVQKQIIFKLHAIYATITKKQNKTITLYYTLSAHDNVQHRLHRLYGKIKKEAENIS